MADNNSYNGLNYSNANGSPRYRGEEIAQQYGGQGGLGTNANDDEIDLRQIFGLLWHNKWLIMATTFVFGLGAFFYAQSQIPIYESNGSLQISEAGIGTPWLDPI
jgi:hypothetical protein